MNAITKVEESELGLNDGNGGAILPRFITKDDLLQNYLVTQASSNGNKKSPSARYIFPDAPRSGILCCLPLARDLSRYPPKRELSRKLARPRFLFPRASAFVVGRVVQSWVNRFGASNMNPRKQEKLRSSLTRQLQYPSLNLVPL